MGSNTISNGGAGGTGGSGGTAVRVVLPMVTVVMGDLVEKAALLMVAAVEKDMMPDAPQIMVFL